MYGEIGFFTVASTVIVAVVWTAGKTTRAETRFNIDIYFVTIPPASVAY